MGTTNIELIELAKKLDIKYFRGVICRDQFSTLLPALENETGIYNFNDSSKGGSHWAAYCKRNDKFFHFCSYGSDPCKELEEYADKAFANNSKSEANKNNKKEILTHTYRIQDWDEKNCGEWCILFCYLISNPKLSYEDVVLFFLE